MEKRIDITSTAVEKTIDLAKGFLDKLVGPAIEETGLLIKDHVTLWRFKNQIKMLNKAKEYCEKNNVLPKTISLKLLCPILDYAAIEENEVLQNKWAILLSNMVDSEQNIDNHVFPYLLSQISTDEFLFIENSLQYHYDIVDRLRKELDDLRAINYLRQGEISERIKVIDIEVNRRKQNNLRGNLYISYSQLDSEKWSLGSEAKNLVKREDALSVRITRPIEIDSDDIKGYELSNLIRLGLVKVIYRPYANTKTLEIPNNPDSSYLRVDFEVEIESDIEEYILTDLGELFINACNERK